MKGVATGLRMEVRDENDPLAHARVACATVQKRGDHEDCVNTTLES